MVLVDVSGLMEAGFMESGPSAIHVSILASSLHEDAPAAEPMGLENEVFCIEENGSAAPFFRTSDFLISPDLQPPVAGSAPRWVDAAVTLK
ncbi:hypothetical protein, partial [Xanthomonas citri]